MLTDDQGHEMSAMKVFSESIRFLKEHLIRTCEDRDYGLKEHETHWVLTVPAIWDDAAKQFMREAAVHVCIQDQIKIRFILNRINNCRFFVLC